MVLCKPKRKFHQSPKVLKKNKREIKKSQPLLKNSEKSVELKTKPKEQLCWIEFKHILLIIKNQPKLKLTLEELQKLADKSMFLPNLALLLLLEFVVSTNLILDLLEFWDYSDLDNSTTVLLLESIKLLLIFLEKLNHILLLGIYYDNLDILQDKLLENLF